MKRALRWVGIILGGLVAVILLAGVVLYIRGNAMTNRVWDIEVAPLEVPTDEAAIAEGERVYVTRGCWGCHGEDGGGQVLFDEPGLAVLSASNLTSGGIGADYETSDYIRAILHGVGMDDRALIEMPSAQYQHMRAEEIAPLIAYLQSLPAVDNDLPETSIEGLGRVLMATGLFPPPAAFVIDHDAVQPAVAASGASIENGEALAAQMCVPCHQANLAGGPIAFDPSTVAPNITFHEEGIAGWTLDDFIAAIRTGVTPDGDQLGDAMPWKSLALLTDNELESLYLYLESIEPLPQRK